MTQGTPLCVEVAQERRREPRLHGPFSSFVFRRTTGGRATSETVVEDISDNAVRLLLPGTYLTPGAMVTVLVSVVGPAPRLIVRGRVMRIDQRSGGSIAAVIAVTRKRWLVPSRAAARQAPRLFLVHIQIN